MRDQVGNRKTKIDINIVCNLLSFNQLVYVFHRVFQTHNPKLIFFFSEIIYRLAVLTQSIRAMMT